MESSLNNHIKTYECSNNNKEQDEINNALKITIGKKEQTSEEDKEKEYKTTINNIKLTYDNTGIYEEIPIKTLIDNTRKPTEILRKIALINCDNDTSDINFYENKQQINNNKIVYASVILFLSVLI